MYQPRQHRQWQADEDVDDEVEADSGDDFEGGTAAGFRGQSRGDHDRREVISDINRMVQSGAKLASANLAEQVPEWPHGPLPRGRGAGSVWVMLHMIKLAVGIRDIGHLAEVQARRAKADPPLRHQTRNAPKRAAEIIAGGSIYWVVQRVVCVRQRILDIVVDVWDDGSKCTGLILDPELIRVAGRSMKPFQGWRYLNAADAPPDLGQAGAVSGVDDLPEGMRRDLALLALL